VEAWRAVDEPVRVDKWVWTARFAKSRSIATELVKGGRVHVNGEAVKPSRDVRPGDRVEMTLGQSRVEVIVRGTAERRGPAREAALLYEETEASRAARERRADERRVAGRVEVQSGGRPTKRDRRRFDKERRG
jgi:ribosome-associated heat shock protein Hsp15